MPAGRRKPHNPAAEHSAARVSDYGPATPAAMAGAKVELFTGPDGVATPVKVRFGLINDYARQGVLTQHQHAAALAILDAHEATLRSPEWLGVFVDKSPDPSAVAVNQAEALTKLAKLAKLASIYWPVVRLVVIDGHTVKAIARPVAGEMPSTLSVWRAWTALRRGLDRVANGG